MRILAIDPGPTSSGWALFETEPFKLKGAGDDANEEIRRFALEMFNFPHVIPDLIVMEQPTLIGQRNIQEEVITTAIEFGRFFEAFEKAVRIAPVFRREVLRGLFGSYPKNADSHVKLYLKQEFGEVGTPKNPGPLCELRGLKHAWQALAAGVAVSRK